jgi:hypothetical protein
VTRAENDRGGEEANRDLATGPGLCCHRRFSPENEVGGADMYCRRDFRRPEDGAVLLTTGGASGCT